MNCIFSNNNVLPQNLVAVAYNNPPTYFCGKVLNEEKGNCTIDFLKHLDAEIYCSPDENIIEVVDEDQKFFKAISTSRTSGKTNTFEIEETEEFRRRFDECQERLAFEAKKDAERKKFSSQTH